MTTLHEAAQQALEALELAVHQNSHDMILTGEELRDGEAAIEALREALAQQPELSTASKSEQLLASHDHALRAKFQRTKAALAQQGEQPVAPEQVEAAWRAGWAACRDAEYVGKEAEDEAWGMSQTCANADWENAGAAPAAQPDTWTDDGGWTFPIEKHAQPLTDEQIEEMHEEQDFIATLFQVKRIVRATELAHGIGEKK